jgi:hypothetical protein
MIGVLAVWNLTIIPLEMSLRALKTGIVAVFMAIAEFEERVIGLQAILASFSRFAEDPIENFKIAGEAAESVMMILLKRNRETIASLNETALVFQTMLASGARKYINNLEEATDLAVLLSNAIASITTGQDRSRQLAEETRSFFTGQFRAQSLLVRLMFKTREEMEKFKKEAKESGNFVQQVKERLDGFVRAARMLGLTFAGLRATFETLGTAFARAGFFKVFDDLRREVKGFADDIFGNMDLFHQMAASVGAAFTIILKKIRTLIGLNELNADTFVRWVIDIMPNVLIQIDLWIRRIELFAKLLGHLIPIFEVIIAKVTLVAVIVAEAFLNLGRVVSFVWRHIREEIFSLFSDIGVGDLLTGFFGGGDYSPAQLKALSDFGKRLEGIEKRTETFSAKMSAWWDKEMAGSFPISKMIAKLGLHGIDQSLMNLEKIDDTIKALFAADKDSTLAEYLEKVRQEILALIKESRDLTEIPFMKDPFDIDVKELEQRARIAMRSARANITLLRESLENFRLSQEGIISITLIEAIQDLGAETKNVEQIIGKVGVSAKRELFGLARDISMFIRQSKDIYAAGDPFLSKGAKAAFLGSFRDMISDAAEISKVLPEAHRKNLQDMARTAEEIFAMLSFQDVGDASWNQAIDKMEEMGKTLSKITTQLGGTGTRGTGLIGLMDDLNSMLLEMAARGAKAGTKEFDTLQAAIDQLRATIKSLEGDLKATKKAMVGLFDMTLLDVVDRVVNSIRVDLVDALTLWLETGQTVALSFKDIMVMTWNAIKDAGMDMAMAVGGALAGALVSAIRDGENFGKAFLKSIGDAMSQALIQIGTTLLMLGTGSLIASFIPFLEPMFNRIASLKLMAYGAAMVAAGAAMGGGARGAGGGTSSAGGSASTEVPEFAFNQADVNVQQGVILNNLVTATANLNSTVSNLTSMSPGALVKQGNQQQGGVLNIVKKEAASNPSGARNVGASLGGSGQSGRIGG